MTHCDGFRAAAVGRDDSWLTIGIDAEPNAPLHSGVLQQVASRREAQMVAILHEEHASLAWDRLLFSAKEAIFKAWSPLTGKWLGFEEASVQFEVFSSTFRASLAQDRALDCPALANLTGRWFLESGYLFTAVMISARPQHHDR